MFILAHFLSLLIIILLLLTLLIIIKFYYNVVLCISYNTEFPGVFDSAVWLF